MKRRYDWCACSMEGRRDDGRQCHCGSAICGSAIAAEGAIAALLSAHMGRPGRWQAFALDLTGFR